MRHLLEEPSAQLPCRVCDAMLFKQYFEEVSALKEIIFSCWASSGKCDSTDWKWEFEVSDEEYDRLKRVVDNEDCFSDCPDVADIYDKLYSAMLDQQADVYLENEDLLQEIVEDLELEDDTNITREQIVDYLQDRYSWGIELPDGLNEQ